MRRFVLTLAALLAAPALASGETWGWATANGKDMCAGIITDCNDATTCTTVGVGPCEGDAAAPTAYLKSSLVGLALVKEATYLANASDMSILNATGPGFRDFKKNVDFPPTGTKTSGTSVVFALRCVLRVGGDMQETPSTQAQLTHLGFFSSFRSIFRVRVHHGWQHLRRQGIRGRRVLPCHGCRRH